MTGLPFRQVLLIWREGFDCVRAWYNYKAEFEVTFPDGSIETFTSTPTQLRVVITPELG